MTDAVEHRECSEALGAYALGALPEPDSERVRRHILDCANCRSELDGLRAAVDAIPASVPQIEPPPELKARLMQIIEAEAEQLHPAEQVGERTGRQKLAWRLIFRPAFGLASVFVVAVVIAVALLAGGGTSTRTVSAHVSGALITAHAHASLQLRDTRAQLVLSDVPAPPAGHVDEAWVQRGSGSPQPAGTFVVRSGSVDVTRPVHPGDRVLVTVEPGGGSAAPTTAPVIVARA